MECRSFPKKEPRQKLLAALFLKAREMGIESEYLRDELAPKVIGRRLSVASSQDIFKLLEHITGIYGRSGYKNFESSKAGLIEELKSAARARWSEGFEKPLNAFINANRPAKTHYRFLNVAALKAVKERIKELNRQDAHDLG